MNEIWSKCIQGADTLYYSRRLRFDDRFRGAYAASFGNAIAEKSRILEIGCGPGALAEALRRWYPSTEIVGIDRDSGFIDYAARRVGGVSFMEGDATALPFMDESFDVTISNTVAEHIEPSLFFGEQYRVLKPGGSCIVLSSRRGISVVADCCREIDAERDFWARASADDDTFARYGIGKYATNEAELPRLMEKYGFHDVTVSYVAVNLTPDDPSVSAEMAAEIINAERYGALDSLAGVEYAMPKGVTREEIRQMRSLVNAKYDERLSDYAIGKKHWDVQVSLLMIVRGTK